MRVLLASTLLLLPGLCTAQEPFRHPGILLDADLIAATSAAITTGDPVKTRAWQALRAEPLARLDHQPRPRAIVECGGYSKPDHGCTDETNDAAAAYAHALQFAYSQDARHAHKAIEIMDAWATTLVGGHTLGNAALQASWSAQVWTRAAEIIRHAPASPWPDANARRFGEWLLSQYLPDIRKVGPCQVANWQASAIEARANIAVYTDRRDLYEEAIADWRAWLPALIYDEADGPTPVRPPTCTTSLPDFWFGQTQMAAGLAQETCRDLEHTAYGLAALINVAETDRLQGGRLYAAGRARLRAAMEFHTDMASRQDTPGWLCKGKLKGTVAGTFEVAYAHYAGREGSALPLTRRWLGSHRPSRGYFHYRWETLTHGIPLGD